MNQSLATVTTDLIESDGNTAKNVIGAYRVGNERALAVVEQQWGKAVSAAAQKLTEEVRLNALSAQKKLGAYYIKGITLTADGAETTVSKAVELAAKGVQQVASNAGKFEKATGNHSLTKLALAAVPAAISISKVAGQIEKKSSQWMSSAAGAAPKKAKTRRAAKVA